MKTTKIPPKTFQKVVKRVGKYPFSLCAILFFSVVYVLATLFVPVFFGDGIDFIIAKGKVDFDGLTRVFFRIGLCVVVAAISEWLVKYLNTRLALRVVEQIRKEGFEKITKLPLSYLDIHAQGDTMSRILSDAEHFSDGLLMGFTQLFTGVLMIVVTLIMMFVANGFIALLVVLITPLSLLVARYISKHTHDFFVLQAETRAEETAFSEEMISSLKTVQAFSHEKENEEAFDKIDERLKKASLDATFYSSLVNPSTRFVNNLVYALVALFGALSIARGSFTVGGLTKFLSYASQYTKPFNEVSGVITELQNSLVCASRIFAFLEEEEEPKDGVETLGEVDEVRFENVAFSYVEDKPLLEGLNLSIKRGDKVAIVGPTGSGKTTLINLLMRFYDVKEGGIFMGGKDIRAVQRRSLRKQFGMVLQDTWLKNDTVLENVRMGNPSASEEEVVEACKKVRADGFIRRMENGYHTQIVADGDLSIGERQLLCIARIMLSSPSLLILDEATSSIDTRTEQKIVEAFDRLMVGRTSFVVAHRLSTIRSADVILVLKDGKIIEQGNHEELLSKGGFYTELWNSQYERTE